MAHLYFSDRLLGDDINGLAGYFEDLANHVAIAPVSATRRARRNAARAGHPIGPDESDVAPWSTYDQSANELESLDQIHPNRRSNCDRHRHKANKAATSPKRLLNPFGPQVKSNVKIVGV